MPSVYSLLNRDAKNWWYFKQLRDQGAISEARCKERGSIKSKIDTLRHCIKSGGYVNVGRGGWSIHYADGQLQGYGGVSDPIVQAAIKAGIVVIDTTTIDDDKIVDIAFKCPMVAVGRKADSAPYNSMSFAPLSYVVGVKRNAGATVYNFKG